MNVIKNSEAVYVKDGAKGLKKYFQENLIDKYTLN